MRAREEPVAHRVVQGTGATEDQCPHAPQIGGEHAEADQRVHRGCRVACIDRRSTVEGPCTPGHDDRREDERRPLPSGELQDGHHRQRNDGQGKGKRHPESNPQGCDLGIVDGGIGYQRRRITGLLDRPQEVGHLDVRTEVDMGAFGGVVDRGTHPGNLVELALNAGGTGGARHAGDGQLHALRHVHLL